MTPTQFATILFGCFACIGLALASGANAGGTDCTSNGQCSLDHRCEAESSTCIPNTSDEARFPKLDRLHFQFGGPAADPGCRRCTATFELAPVRRLLEVAEVREAVRLRLLDKGNLPFADLGTFSPRADGSWAELPTTAEAALTGRLPDRGGCGYHLEVSDAAGERSVRRSLCLTPR